MRREGREEARCANEGGKAQRRKPGGKNTNRQREEHRKTQENLKDTVGHGKTEHKTQQDMIQRHGHQIQADTRQKKT